MYESYFGLTGNPFGMTPDPRFYYQNQAHREAYAALKYGVQERRGFMTLIGEVGTGKTTLLNALVEELEPGTCPILVTHTTVDREELLRVILHKLHTGDLPGASVLDRGTNASPVGTRLAGMSRVELINEFRDFTASELMAYRPPPLLIIDEAQNLAEETLEEVRLLTNLEGPASKHLQVILAGQPELESMLVRPCLRQLRQRIAVIGRLQPMSCAETFEYITFRLQKAGCDRNDLFAERAVGEIWTASEGIPRIVNVLCDHAMVNAFAAGAEVIDESLAKEAIQDVMSYRLGWTKLKRPKPYLMTESGSVRLPKAAHLIAAAGEKRRDPIE